VTRRSKCWEAVTTEKEGGSFFNGRSRPFRRGVPGETQKRKRGRTPRSSQNIDSNNNLRIKIRACLSAPFFLLAWELETGPEVFLIGLHHNMAVASPYVKSIRWGQWGVFGRQGGGLSTIREGNGLTPRPKCSTKRFESPNLGGRPGRVHGESVQVECMGEATEVSRCNEQAGCGRYG